MRRNWADRMCTTKTGTALFLAITVVVAVLIFWGLWLAAQNGWRILTVGSDIDKLSAAAAIGFIILFIKLDNVRDEIRRQARRSRRSPLDK